MLFILKISTKIIGFRWLHLNTSNRGVGFNPVIQSTHYLFRDVSKYLALIKATVPSPKGLVNPLSSPVFDKAGASYCAL